MTDTITPPRSDDGPCSRCKEPVVVWRLWIPGRDAPIIERICWSCGCVEAVH